jgi:hypothetical protein
MEASMWPLGHAWSRELIYLRYLGVPIREKSYMFGDNESVVNSSIQPHAKLHKRHMALSFHRVRSNCGRNIRASTHYWYC